MLDKSVERSIPTRAIREETNFVLGEISGGVNGEVEGDRGKNNDGSDEDEGKDGKGDLETTSAGHGMVGRKKGLGKERRWTIGLVCACVH